MNEALTGTHNYTVGWDDGDTEQWRYFLTLPEAMKLARRVQMLEDTSRVSIYDRNGTRHYRWDTDHPSF